MAITRPVPVKTFTQSQMDSIISWCEEWITSKKEWEEKWYDDVTIEVAPYETNAIASQINAEIELTYNIHLVTCWNCGSIISWKPLQEKYKCNCCNFEDEACHFPDLFY